MKSWKEHGPAASQALAEIFALVTMNVYTLLAWCDFIFGTRFSSHVLNLSDPSNLLKELLVLAVIWALFIFSGYYKKIIQDVKNKEDQGQYVLSERARRAYEIVSFILLFISLMLPVANA
jgi:hypothetical protein